MLHILTTQLNTDDLSSFSFHRIYALLELPFTATHQQFVNRWQGLSPSRMQEIEGAVNGLTKPIKFMKSYVKKTATMKLGDVAKWPLSLFVDHCQRNQTRAKYHLMEFGNASVRKLAPLTPHLPWPPLSQAIDSNLLRILFGDDPEVRSIYRNHVGPEEKGNRDGKLSAFADMKMLQAQSDRDALPPEAQESEKRREVIEREVLRAIGIFERNAKDYSHGDENAPAIQLYKVEGFTRHATLSRMGFQQATLNSFGALFISNVFVADGKYRVLVAGTMELFSTWYPFDATNWCPWTLMLLLNHPWLQNASGAEMLRFFEGVQLSPNPTTIRIGQTYGQCFNGFPPVMLEQDRPALFLNESEHPFLSGHEYCAYAAIYPKHNQIPARKFLPFVAPLTDEQLEFIITHSNNYITPKSKRVRDPLPGFDYDDYEIKRGRPKLTKAHDQE